MESWFIKYAYKKSWVEPFIDILNFTAPCFTVLCRYHFFFFFFYKSKVCGNTESNKSISVTIFPTVFAHFISLFSILVILILFQIFSLLYLWCDYYNCLGELWTVPIHETGNLIDKLCPDYSTDQPFSHLSPTPLASSICRDTAILKLGQ